MPSTVSAMTFDATDPKRLADFWCQVLDYHVTNTGESLDGTAFVEIGGNGPTLLFEQVPDRTSRHGKNPVHLDLDPPKGGHAEEVDRVLGLGARRAAVGLDPRLPWVVLLDPEGNEFCVLDHDRPSPVEA
ncbi:hypothetical protein JOF53_000463 [Crossiella equi]|uniref:Glyoxalase-like domain-containing protein n=1 Tax=Crossiella equi TaxID=130796 RepID=A0ABS5A5L5_9PSEU|nr:VOC family protein [Crossiella equi]MBP2471591.1 hypothetical protein [Crossiella equi]